MTPHLLAEVAKKKKSKKVQLTLIVDGFTRVNTNKSLRTPLKRLAISMVGYLDIL